MAGLSPMPFVSPAHQSGPHMQPRPHTSSSAAPTTSHDTHAHILAPAHASSLLQPQHMQPHAGSLYSQSLLDTASFGTQASLAHQSQLQPGNFAAAPLFTQAGSPAGQHMPHRPTPHTSTVDPAQAAQAADTTRLPVSAAVLAALPHSLQQSSAQQMHQQQQSAHTALQAGSDAFGPAAPVAPIALPRPALLPVLQHQPLHQHIASTVPTNSPPSKPHPLPQAMSSFDALSIKPQLIAPAVLPPISATGPSTAGGIQSVAAAGHKWDEAGDVTGTHYSLGPNSLQATRASHDDAGHLHQHQQVSRASYRQEVYFDVTLQHKYRLQ